MRLRGGGTREKMEEKRRIAAYTVGREERRREGKKGQREGGRKQ